MLRYLFVFYLNNLRFFKKTSIWFYILVLYKTNNECFHSCNGKNIFIRWKMKFSIPLGCRLVEWKISSFTSWKYFYHCTHKHSLFVMDGMDGGWFSSLCACASRHWFQKYGGLHEERTLAEGFRKGENKDKNDCHKTTRDTWEEINAGKGHRSAEKRFWIDTKQVCW